MSEIGTERVESTARMPDQPANEPRREARSRPRRQAPSDTSNSDQADRPETPQHQVDSLA